MLTVPMSRAVTYLFEVVKPGAGDVVDDESSPVDGGEGANFQPIKSAIQLHLALDDDGDDQRSHSRSTCSN